MAADHLDSILERLSKGEMVPMPEKLFTKIWMSTLLASLLLISSACSTALTSMPPTTTNPTSMAFAPSPPLIALATDTAQPAPTPTPNQQAITFIPTTFEQPGAWSLRHPYSDPHAPVLITPATDGYALNQDFQVASIELSYRWIGIGDSVYDYQRIERRDSGFWKNDQPISTEAVDKLVQAIAHLHPQPHTVSVTVWSDDYPYWAIELTSMNGDNVLLYSDSNASSYIPWNVIFNGKIYAQYTGDIPSALDGLFTVFEDRTISYSCGCQNEGYLPANSFEPQPEQISEGFNGLLPIYHDFSYYADLQNGELRGYLSGESRVDQVGQAQINWLTDLRAIDLDSVPGQTVSCSLENMPNDDPQWIYWKFNCPVGSPVDRISYRYPIRLTYATSNGQPYILSGELFGYWEPSTTLPFVPYPDEIGVILKSSPPVNDLLQDHLVYFDYTLGYADPSTGVITHEWDADVVLLGQVQVGQRTVPYTVNFDKVYIKDGTVVRWDLNRAKLEDLLKEVLNQTVTRRFLEVDPHAEIDLYYAEYDDHPIIEAGDLPACAYLPDGKELPQPGQPLRGFGFNQSRTVLGSAFYDMQIVFMDGSLRVFQLDLDPASPGDAYWMSVLPEALKPKGAPPFMTIQTRLGISDINLLWDEQTNPATVSYYESMFSGWDVTRLTEFDQGLRLNHRWYDLTPEGGLTLLECQGP
jgi:hypothetical protein